MTPAPTDTRPAPDEETLPLADIDPRISARRDEVIRQQGRRRLQVVGIVVAAVVLLAGGWLLFHTWLFSARAVTVVGDVHETAAQVEVAAGLAYHPPLIDINAAAAVSGMERLPWVRSASVSLHWPDGVRVVISERVPDLVMSTSIGRWAELTSGGRVLSDVVARPPGLVEITGPRAPGPPGSVLGVQDAVGLRIAATLPESFRAQVTGVHIEPGGWVQLSMTTPIVVDIGTATQLPAKYEDVSAILAGATLHVGDIIDVSVPDAPTVTGG